MIETIITRDFGTPAKQITLATEMITLTIDGYQVTVPAGTSLMRAAAENAINIPKLCATDSLE
ncbi:MAG: formate dehydrogenase subunit alpha, partial [Massilia sp.]|nr:formate dehydrogenase subunit alpha [Massilia sp.]